MTDRAKTGSATDSAGSGVEPLLSGGGRDFLAGTIDADEFVESVRRTALQMAQGEAINEHRPQHGPLRLRTGSVLVAAAVAYVALGIATLISEPKILIGAVAFVTGAVFAVLGLTLVSSARSARLNFGSQRHAR
jgi:hypothetical protein